MPRDAKVGLILGVCIVVVLSLVYFRNGPANAKADEPPAASVGAFNPITPEAGEIKQDKTKSTGDGKSSAKPQEAEDSAEPGDSEP